MDEGNKNLKNNKEEIGLNEVLSYLVKEKGIIAIITLIVITISAIYSFVLSGIEYHSKTLINILPNEHEIITPYGNFKNSNGSINDYLALSKEDKVLELTEKDMGEKYSRREISRSIKTETINENPKNIQSFSIVIKGDSEEEVTRLTDSYIKNYLQYVHYDLTYRAMTHLNGINQKNIEQVQEKIKSNESIKESVEELIKATPKTIKVQEKQYTIREIHPAYIAFLGEVAKLDIEKVELLLNLDTSIRNEEVLSKEIERVEKLKENPASTDLNEALLKAVSDIVTVDEELSKEVIITKPKYLRNLTTALVLGLMIGGFVAFLKNYWKKQWVK